MNTQDQDHVSILEVGSDVELLLYRTVLQEAGIDVMVRRTGEPVIAGNIFRLRQPQYQLSVSAGNEATARQLISDYQRQMEAGDLQQGDDGESNVKIAPSRRMGRWFFWRITIAVIILTLLLIAIAVIPQIISK